MTAPLGAAGSLLRVMRLLVSVLASLYFALFLFNTVTRTGRFSPDSINYVNVAESILNGKGISQPTVGFNEPRFPVTEKPPVPFTAQAPLYPILISFVSRIGLSAPRAALLLAALALILVFVLTYKLATELYDDSVGLTTATILLVYLPIKWMSGFAWSDPIGICFVLLTLWLLVRNSASNRSKAGGIAGLVAGLGFATRFALLPLAVVGVVFLLLNSTRLKSRLADVTAFAVGFGIPLAIVAVRNYLLTGSFSPRANPFRVGIWENINGVWEMVFGTYADGMETEYQIALLALSIAIFFVILFVRRDLRNGLCGIFYSKGRWLPAFWCVSYLIFLVAQRSRSYFDLDPRTIAPAGVVLVMLWSAAVVRATRIPSAVISLGTVTLLVLALWREGHASANAAIWTRENDVSRSKRLTWLRDNTTDADLIIGDDVIDIPFYLHRPATVSFSPYPYTDRPTYDGIIAYSRQHCSEYNRILLALHRNSESEEAWRSAFGDFFADLMAGQAGKYPDIVVLQALDDGLVFQVQCR